MKEIVVLSGKGGTGKTSIVGSLAALAERKVLADCDVDAADLHLLLSPSVTQETEFWSGQIAWIDLEKCTRCGLCQELCRFDAILDYKVDPTACEGCGFCAHVCPVAAITMKENLSGHLFVSETRYGPLVHARLGIAQENSGKLVARVRQEAKQISEKQGLY
jgi:MinD superfamily P-loop ATPase